MVSLTIGKQVANNIMQKFGKNTLKDTAPDIKLCMCFLYHHQQQIFLQQETLKKPIEAYRY